MGACFAIHPMPTVLDARTVDQLSRYEASQLADCVGKPQAAGSHLVGRHDGTRLVGCALTVRTKSGDHLMVQKAIDLARPGDVIVVDGGGFTEQALVGEIMVTLATKRGIAGFVIDGAVRDLRFLRDQSLPVYSTAVCLRGPSRIGPGEINVCISVAGMQVRAGDIVVADADGVVAIPRNDVPAVLQAAEALSRKESATLLAVQNGDVDREWIDAALHAGGCHFISGS
ncbi:MULTISPECIES: hypothetical protein [unclassified Variovorax]|uniref:RraA family protein n=1 Tax=unclassified Variovorax TaxID=663243 RepID=UPI0008B25094|nr:hypothetical protein [Variovorax sp. OV084]SEU20105.1 Regulator of RNase E activity RraA [Variovorax sp. OV084]